MKKVYLCSLSLLCAALGMNQAALAAPATVSIGSCQITNVTAVNHDYNTNTITLTGGTLGTGCGSTPPAAGTTYVTASPTSISYTLGTTPGSLTFSWSSSDTGASCTVAEAAANPAKLLSNPAAANAWILNTPTVAGSYSYPITCTTTTMNGTAKNTVVNPGAVQLTVSAAPPPPPPPASNCAASQASVGLTVALQRLCTGVVTYYGVQSDYKGALASLDTILVGSWGGYYTGTLIFPTTAGYYQAYAFTPVAGASLSFSVNTSWGDGGQISVSSTPGDFSATAACFQNAGGRNSMVISSSGGTNCIVTPGQTYYLNFANTSPTRSNAQSYNFANTYQ